MVYITGGTSSVTPYMGDILTYTFATNKWSKINPKSSSKIPDSRYGHCSFVYNEDLYIYGGVVGSRGRVDMWRLSGKQWVAEQPANPDIVPLGRVGQTCTLITTNNTTQLAVFGGMNDAGRTMRELFLYNFKTSRWEKAAHQNSVALAGATAVYHKATESIYYFGGMINQTTRNVITYQYVIQQDLWHALAPRIDPLTAAPVTFSGQNPSNSSDGGWDGGGPDNASGGLRERYLPPVMYDSSSVVWAPASLVDDDLVVFYGGMRPFGLGINPYDSSCYAQSVLIYDLSCQNWTKIDFADITGTVKSRVNHTMILRPPRSPGGSATAWTLYVFGGFDGRESQDMFNITFNIPTLDAAGINACRALRWCNHYDDCQNCNQNYCTYVNGLCLFDTEKASHSSSSGYLVGETSDIPKDGTFQDLIRQRPELRDQVMTEETCPPRTALDTGATHNVVLQPGQEASFKTFIDANDLDIQFHLQTNPSLPLQFRSSNVWEGYMNMYWRATHGLTDNSWDGNAWTSSPIPSDIPDTLPNGVPNTPVDRVVTTSGTLNTTELYSRWMKYAGLDASPSTSALWQSVSTYVDFPAGDPRRFSGYYIYTIKNLNQEPVTLTLVVNLLDHSDDDGSRGNGQFDLATLGFAMVGFIVGVLALFLIGHKVRRFLNERERAAAIDRLQREQERGEETGQIQADNPPIATSAADRQSLKDRKPMYRIVVGVQPDVKEILGIGGFDNTTLRHRHVNRNNRPLVATLTTPGAASALGTGVESKASLGVPGSSRLRSHSESVTQPPPPRMEGTSKTGSPRSDFICDLGSTQTHSSRSRRSTSTTGAGMGVGAVPYIHPRDPLPPTTENTRTEPVTDQQGDLTLDFGTSFNSSNLAASLGLPYESSGNRAGDKSGNQEGRQEGVNDNVTAGETRTRDSPGIGVGHGVQPSTDSAPTVIDFGASYISDTMPAAVVASRPRRNPVRVQPISIEPLPFHGPLVPRTRRNFRRYQRLVAKRRPQVNRGNSRSRTSLFVRSLSQKSTPKPVEGKIGTLKRAQRAATRLNLKASMDPSTGATTTATAYGSRGEDTNAIEMIRLERGGSRRQPSGTSSQGPVALEKLQKESEKNSLGPRSVRTKGPRGYDPGPLVAVNVLIVFPGDAKTRPVMITEPSDEVEAQGGYGTAPFIEGGKMSYSGNYASSATGSMDPDGQRLPPMAIGTLIAPDPVRWWAYKTRQHLDRQQLEKETKRLYQQKQRQLELQRRRQDQPPAKPAE
ncbi:hypothetical protein BGX34_010365 [Mortierella sp. NVP85]|nr:hypothetical protein BGX34_010365 [Mortierella sp. NVP85]